jgi:hypothetical protein
MQRRPIYILRFIDENNGGSACGDEAELDADTAENGIDDDEAEKKGTGDDEVEKNDVFELCSDACDSILTLYY